MSNRRRPLVLTILDGWGYRAETRANAIALARKPTYDKLLAEFPNSLLHASDHFVGLPDGQMGNSEVGHLNIGAGRIVSMDITRIDMLIATGEFYTHPVIVDAMQRALQGGKQLHLLGLLSDGGVHSHQNHLYALLKAAKQMGLEHVFIHAFMDGRDTAPTGGAEYLAALDQKIREIGVGQDRQRLGPLLRHGSRPALGAGVESLRRDGHRPSGRRSVLRPDRTGEGTLQQRHDRRIHHSICGGRCPRPAGSHDSRRRCLHQLQLPR